MWQLEKTKAGLLNSLGRFEIDTQTPETGLNCGIAGRQTWAGTSFLGVESPHRDLLGDPVCENVYVRGADLVALYRMSKQPEITWQIYWRELPTSSQGACGVELILSVQTELLDSDPCLTVSSRIPGTELWQIAPEASSPMIPISIETTRSSSPLAVARPGVLLYRLPELEYSYVEMIHAADFEALEIYGGQEASPEFASRFRLFGEHLEKGVIRRARLRGMLVPRAGDVAVATECYHSFLDSAIPLTA